MLKETIRRKKDKKIAYKLCGIQKTKESYCADLVFYDIGDLNPISLKANKKLKPCVNQDLVYNPYRHTNIDL